MDNSYNAEIMFLLIPVTATVFIAITGFIIQYFYFRASRNDRAKELRLAAVEKYYLDLIRLLSRLKWNFCGLLNSSTFNYDDANRKIFSAMEKMPKDHKSKVHIEQIIKIYKDIIDVSSSGNYVYLNRELHFSILKLVNHIECILFLEDKKFKKEELNTFSSEYGLPDITVMIDDMNEKMKY